MIANFRLLVRFLMKVFLTFSFVSGSHNVILMTSKETTTELGKEDSTFDL